MQEPCDLEESRPEGVSLPDARSLSPSLGRDYNFGCSKYKTTNNLEGSERNPKPLPEISAAATGLPSHLLACSPSDPRSQVHIEAAVSGFSIRKNIQNCKTKGLHALA